MNHWLMIPFFALVFLLAGCDRTDGSVDAWPLVTDCDLHQQACTARHGGATVTLDIRPRPIRVARPLDVTVQLDKLQATAVALDISGINMYMGYNRVKLKPVGQNRWEGKTMLAFCTNQTMVWQVGVLVTRPDGTQVMVPFKLVTRRDGRFDGGSP